MADQKNPPELDHLAPPWFHKVWDKLVDWLKENRPVQGVGIQIIDSATGKVISAVAQAGFGSGSFTHPFQVTVSTDEDGNPQGTVELDSWLLKSLRLNDKFTITGLGSPFALEADTIVYLEIAFDSATGLPDTATIKAEPWGGATDKPYELDSESEAENTQTSKVWHVIAEVREDDGTYPNRVKFSIGEDPYEIHQVCRDNLVLCQTCIDGHTLTLPFPYSAPALQLPATE